MTATTGSDPAAPAPSRLVIDGRVAFAEAVRAALRRVADDPARELFLVDADFVEWPLGERSVVECLDRWARTHRRLVLAACDWSAVPNRHPRWVAWRRIWSHVVECRQLLEIESSDCPTLMLAPGVCTLRLVDTLGRRGALHWGEAVAARDAKAQIDALLQRSEPGFPVTTLGL